MRYGRPSIEKGFDRLLESGCGRILVFPLYPQYSASTTASAVDATGDALKKLRHQPTLRFVPPYFEDEAYINALAVSLKRQLQELDFSPDVILASYHGLPRSFVDKGDPYPSHCKRTSELLKQALGDQGYKLQMSYQSRVGPMEWLHPHTDETLEKLARSGVRNVAVITPGFAADCLETLEEIAMENARIFKKAGGRRFVSVKCLNDSTEAIDMMKTIVLRELEGWIAK